MVTPAVMRNAVADLVETYEMSERRAYTLIGVDRSSVRYRRVRPDDAALRTRMREFAAERRRFGYRRLHVLLRREGLVANRKRTQRLYGEEGLTVRKRRGRKRAVGTRAPILTVPTPNARWSVSCEGCNRTPGDLATYAPRVLGDAKGGRGLIAATARTRPSV